MRLTEVLGASGVRRILSTAAVLCAGIALVAGFLYWQTIGYLTRQIDAPLIADARAFVVEDAAALRQRLDRALLADRRAGKTYGLFAPDGSRLAGNVASLPAGLRPTGQPVGTRVPWLRDNGSVETVSVRAVVERPGDGSTLILGRRTETLEEITEIVTRAMVLAIVPAIGLSLVGGIVVSRATARRVAAVHEACLSIMAGRFDQRLPVHALPDEFDRLSSIVNAMLDEIERLVMEVKGAGDAIAHDLRTPLTRLRARLERNFETVVDPTQRLALQTSVADVDQLLTTVSALMRIAELEQSRRRENFSKVDLAELVAALAEFYEPIADEKGLSLHWCLDEVAPVEGDGDLLFEAFANLVDNAIKFTPAGGTVDLAVVDTPAGPAFVVRDTGPGIPPEERGQVLRRFYRIDRSRHQPGSGLGLNLVTAILHLHGFGLSFGDDPSGGLRAIVQCHSAPGTERPRASGSHGSPSALFDGCRPR